MVLSFQQQLKKKKQTVPKQHGECGRQQLGSLPAGTIVTLCFWLSLAGLTVFLWSPPAAPACGHS